ncbi:MAG TPA: RNA methyltransferase [Aquihabitans sp.]|nr:RNA methyltransferase [Aquihabitans sp.]
MAELVAVTEAGHPLLADFVALGDPATRRRVERDGGYFVVEGTLAIERLLALPRWTVRSLALLPRVADRLAPLLATTGAPVAVAPEAVLREVVGFDLHRGALASVERVPAPPAAALLPARGLVVVAEGVNDHENLGALYRNAAAFGAAAVLLDPTCADPFYRRSVRVSLGNVLAVPTGALGPLPDGFGELHAAGVATVALTPGGDRELADLTRRELGDGAVAVVVGAEGPGLAAGTIAAARHRVRIAMAPDVDSLNVATAAAIALHHLSR